MVELYSVRRLTLCFFLAFSTKCAFAQSERGPNGEWILVSTILEHNLGNRLNLNIEKSQLSGYIYRGEKVPLEGTLSGQDIRFSFKESSGALSEYAGLLEGDTMSRNFSTVETSGNKTTGQWSANRVPPEAL